VVVVGRLHARGRHVRLHRPRPHPSGGRAPHRAPAAADDVLGEELEEGEDALSLLRLRTRSHELLLAPAPEATLAVMQRAHSAAFDGYPGLNDDVD
jgi:hypothetical protein